jgi:hypothetical protein
MSNIVVQQPRQVRGGLVTVAELAAARTISPMATCLGKTAALVHRRQRIHIQRQHKRLYQACRDQALPKSFRRRGPQKQGVGHGDNQQPWLCGADLLLLRQNGKLKRGESVRGEHL